MQQQNMLEIDRTGRKAAKLGLSHDHEIVVDVIDEARRLYRSLANYQIGVVNCEMQRLSAGDRASELTRLWADVFVTFSNVGTMLLKLEPIEKGIETEIDADVARERKASKAEGGDAIDKEFRDTFGANPPKPDNEDAQ